MMNFEGEQESYWFIFQGDRLLVAMSGTAARLPAVIDMRQLEAAAVRRQEVGDYQGRPCLAVEVSPDMVLPEGVSLAGLRSLYGLMDEALFLLAGRALQLLSWDRARQFCGCCGRPLAPKPDEQAKLCHDCGAVEYHNPAPAVIVLIEREDELLLARSQRHRGGMYSVLAGFVEPGETLEAAVIREIREEVGLEVRDIRYFGSQPWPFPNSLMIAFTCSYASGEIRLRDGEIADAGWYDAGNLPLIPPPLSIARRLIDWFVAKQKARQ
jgi:NAD+ diphosphatase